jgi:hypothetical protein
LVFLITQNLKTVIDRRRKLPTQLLSTGIAFVVLLGAMFGTGASARSWETYFLALANAFLVAAAAGKMFDDASKQGGDRVAK